MSGQRRLIGQGSDSEVTALKMTMPTSLAGGPSREEWLQRTHRRPSGFTVDETLETLDELRGGWP